jgi:hypothetical protein
MTGCVTTNRNIGKYVYDIHEKKVLDRCPAHEPNSFMWFGGGIKLKYSPITEKDVTTVDVSYYIDKDHIRKNYTPAGMSTQHGVQVKAYITFYFVSDPSSHLRTNQKLPFFG